ncbi:MAG: ABC transporter permease [Candidatus Aminicenantes bacterium]|nr:ABC transporter permease [Candidatus Aminicenantes bacterium]
MKDFDLQKAIQEWKKTLFKDPGLEEGHIIEIEEGLRDEIEELVEGGMSEEEAFSRITGEMAPAEVLGSEFYKVRTRRRSGRPPWQKPKLMPALFWHYLKIALRKVKRQKGYTFINVAGLSVAMACFLLMMTSVQFDLSYDRFHEKADRIFRVAIRSTNPDIEEYSLTTSEVLSKNLRNRIPEVAHAGIIQRSRNGVFWKGTENFIEDGFFADEYFFKMFSFELLRGHPSEVLKAPHSIVLTDMMAKKIFGAEDPMGKSLRYESRFLNCDVYVTGIMGNPPKNSHLQFAYLISTATMADSPVMKEWFDTWDIAAFSTYVELRQKSTQHDAGQKIAALMQEAKPQEDKREDTVYLQPLTDIHLKSRVEGATASNNRIQSVYLFSVVAMIILLIAGINSMNLSTARAATRSQEISLRKVIGARRGQLVRQFLGESYLFTAIAMVFAFLIFHAFFPVFSRFLGNGLTLNHVEKLPLVFSVLVTILFVGAFSGIYPALVLSAFQPASFLKKQSITRLKGIKIRNLLVVFQFSAVVVLMIGTLVVARQLNFIKHKGLGYEKEHVLLLPLKDEETVRKVQMLKTRLLEYPGVLSITISDSSPLGLGMSVSNKEFKKEDGQTMKFEYNIAQVDHDFLEVFGMKIAEGRDFSEDDVTGTRGILVNESFVRKVGWEHPLDMRLNDVPVIGVVQDFHYDTLHHEIEPAVLSLDRDFFGRVYLGLRIRPENTENTLAEIRKIFTQTTNGQPFDAIFLDDAIQGLYRNEFRLASMIGYLEGLAIILGFMGLFGLATYATQRRIKEIGIRKVMGASVSSILRMMSREFMVLVVVSNIIAWPLGIYVLRRWLQVYAYRCSFGIDILLLTGLGTLLIALLAVGLHTVKAAWSNPLDSIRYE